MPKLTYYQRCKTLGDHFEVYPRDILGRRCQQAQDIEGGVHLVMWHGVIRNILPWPIEYARRTRELTCKRLWETFVEIGVAKEGE